ncbi:peptidyl-tRNA hydrolase 2, mitochondrial [Culicoides brevitarsis]|uniref:peptidyl-tRNA hydrolase 2, mitochondrial n=1 Tax=Culicoides brevitarsis TaxID=469753 RepID=UPI00307B6F14
MSFLRRIITKISGTPTKMVLVVRADLKLSKGKTGSQCAHAAVICYHRTLDRHPDLCSTWFAQGQPKIVLKVDSLTELKELQKAAKAQGIVAEAVRDAGRTEIEAGTTTVLGIGPDDKEKIDSIVKHLKLL